ncbi:multiple epidermal growth factor-like domains protein 6 [Haliotis rubra]|uniref:multiple epidermal growth factor-like domains protein 6 n=1 Tax=Haliotis rubra TaxID=36100 RepID=UPI001EE62943|nr:multiple epidermal growth factor-like domains protein 6 [Haliotis rubra]
MFVLRVICLLCTGLSVQAGDCTDSQHCSDCDRYTGHCDTECSDGYFGLQCKSICSKNCRHGKCHLSTTGNDDCTDGCVLGYQGNSCNIPCDSPGGSCTACPGGCDGGYCQVGSSCVSGCVDSYYGTGCKSCSSRCKSCNRMTGTCAECHTLTFGPDCEYSCANCVGSCKFGCLQGCVHGYYGYVCDANCSANCRLIPNTTRDSRGDGTSTRPECHQRNGVCVHGCVDGWYGTQCSYQCNTNCLNGRCSPAGDCVDGCKDGWYGPECSSPCNTNCLNGRCSSTGDCVDGCVTGYMGGDCTACMTGFYGESCNQTCNVCRDGLCDRMSGFCISGCNTTALDCEPACRNNCSIADCLTGSCHQGHDSSYSTIIMAAAPTASVVLVVFILLAVCLCYNRSSRTTSINEVDPGPALMDYCEVTDEDVDRARAARKQEEVEMPCPMLVLADYFHDVAGDVDDDTYSTLLPGVDDQKTEVNYVSPIGD